MTANMEDISRLAAMAYPPGEATGSPESRRDLWRAFFSFQSGASLFTRTGKRTLTLFLKW